MISSSFFPRFVGREESDLWSIRLAPAASDALGRDDWLRMVRQGRDLGAECVVLLVDHRESLHLVIDLARSIGSQSLQIWVDFLNPIVTPEIARTIFEMNVSVVLRLNAETQTIQDWIDSKDAALSEFSNSFEYLREAGYPSDEKSFGVHFSQSRENSLVAPALWQHLTRFNVLPLFDLALDLDETVSSDVSPGPKHINWSDDLFQDGGGCPPMKSNDGMVEAHTCFVDGMGTVFPSENLPIPLGSIQDQSLGEILGESEIFEEWRRHRTTIKAPCGICGHAAHCFGSRAASYFFSGDYLASDPTCWKNKENLASIRRLPVRLEHVIPQKWPMRLVDTLEEIGERSGTVGVRVSKDMPMVAEDGQMEPAFFLEMIAQAMAGVTCFKKQGAAEQEIEGLLLGAQNLEILGHPRVGDQLMIKVFKYARFGDFGMVKGQIEKDGRLLCRGDIKFWHRVALDPNDQEEGD